MPEIHISVSDRPGIVGTGGMALTLMIMAGTAGITTGTCMLRTCIFPDGTRTAPGIIAHHPMDFTVGLDMDRYTEALYIIDTTTTVGEVCGATLINPY